MIRLRETIEVARPIDDVFAYASDFGNAAQWDPGVAESRKTGAGPIGVGTAFKLRVRFGPRSIPMEYAIREFERPRRVLLEGKSDSVHALDDIGFSVTPRGTRITYTADISLLGALSAIEPFLEGALDRLGKNAMRGLQSALGAESPPPGRSRLADLQDHLIVPGLLGFTNVGYRWRSRSWKPTRWWPKRYSTCCAACKTG